MGKGGDGPRSARPSKCQSFHSSGLNFEPFLITLGPICKHFRTIWVAFWGLGAIPPKIFEKGVKKNVSCFLCVFVRVCLYVCECGCLCKCLCMSVCVVVLSGICFRGSLGNGGAGLAPLGPMAEV